MRLTQTGEYALRAMAYMANLPPGQAVRARDLAVPTAVPPHYLSKLMRQLVVAGLIHSQKGHGGGFVLAKAPEEITLEAVLAATHVSLVQEECAFGWHHCNAGRPCPLHEAWSRLKTACLRWARDTTLADLRGADLTVFQERMGEAPTLSSFRAAVANRP
ncbi:Rrf2 family transcriptional regulator [Myxococcota bacterium]|nr:Rrf2 family transcriptional regulator [Myxococcota bacterium]